MENIKYYILLFVLSMIGGSCAKYSRSLDDKNDISKVRDTVINLENVLSLSDNMCLSEIADSIIYIPLETKKELLLSNGTGFKFTKESIITIPRFLFDWNGKFVKQIGRTGQGVGEDPNRYARLLESDNNYYTIGNKIIEYDKNGKYTGREISKFFIKSAVDSSYVFNIFRDVSSILLDGHIVLYQYPDSLIWVDQDMKVSNATRVVEPGEINVKGIFSNKLDCFFTIYNENRFFYNCYNDTIYKLTENGLFPEWVIDLGKKKLPNEVTLYKLGELLNKIIRNPETINHSELIEKTDGKYKVYAAYETDYYLLFNYIEIRYLAHRRNVENPEPRLILYNKQTKKITNVKKGGIIDDLDNGPDFYPTYGAVDEKMISVKWPWELKEYVEINRDRKTISPKLLNLVDSLKDDDNPVIIIAYLKSKI